MLPLNNFSYLFFFVCLFFQKIASLLAFQIYYSIEFESNSKKENTVKVKLEKLKFSHNFPIQILSQSFLNASVHVMSP